MARPKPQLVSVVYRSTAAPGLSSFDLDELLSESRVRNRAASITGMLLLEHGRFLQDLEGPEDEVRALMARIQADPRHTAVQVLADETLGDRRFPDWAMANGRMGDADARPLEAYFDALLGARAELPKPPTRSGRIASWLHR